MKTLYLSLVAIAAFVVFASAPATAEEIYVDVDVDIAPTSDVSTPSIRPATA